MNINQKRICCLFFLLIHQLRFIDRVCSFVSYQHERPTSFFENLYLKQDFLGTKIDLKFLILFLNKTRSENKPKKPFGTLLRAHNYFTKPIFNYPFIYNLCLIIAKISIIINYSKSKAVRARETKKSNQLDSTIKTLLNVYTPAH
ncbi:hypothetical protein BpHYR1_047458 [Brachionus plicatilis]|uniref:Secreted protein n=1 Tax=Brachionus plicatilis TaxID=10195 RepID=A0A3M7QCN6_BRAPC|nr:hypothetical protein BpHYR1_047458 [Brachionus plicatilis]